MPAATGQDYYQVLGVARDAPAEEIRRAYLKLAHKYHPDKTGGDKAAEDKLKRVNEAYDVLKNADKRKEYDQSLNAGFERFQRESYQAQEPTYESGSAPFEDFFSSIFGRRQERARRSAIPGEDLVSEVVISLREAATGVRKTARVSHRETCRECNGSGAAPGSKPVPCTTCSGTGTIRSTEGMFSTSQTCPRCGGLGTAVPNPCKRCNGSGFIRTMRDFPVKVPPGIASGAQLRFKGKGEPGQNGGPAGDVYVRIVVDTDAFFTRQDDDLVCEVPIPFQMAALGGKTRVPTLEGQAELNIPAGTQGGTQFRMRGQGMPHLKGHGKGDELVKVSVEVPTNLSSKQRELIQQMNGTTPPINYPKYRRFLDKLARNRK